VGRVATGLTVTAWGMLTGGLVKRGLASGHWPLASRYEFALCFVWAIVTVYLLLETSWRERRAGPFVLAVALLVATYAVTRSSTEKALMPLPPALRSVWLQVHVLTAMVGYAAFAVAAGLGVMRLVLRTPPGRGEHAPPLIEGAGGSEEIERTMERAVALGFPWLTLALLTGAIWAQNAWGCYWGWDPKETWALPARAPAAEVARQTAGLAGRGRFRPGAVHLHRRALAGAHRAPGNTTRLLTSPNQNTQHAARVSCSGICLPCRPLD